MAVIFCRERKKVCNEISARVSALFLLLRSLLEYPVFTSGMGREYNPILIVFVQKLFQFRLTLKIAQREKYRASEIENKKSLLATFLMNFCVRKISHHDPQTNHA